MKRPGPISGVNVGLTFLKYADRSTVLGDKFIKLTESGR